MEKEENKNVLKEGQLYKKEKSSWQKTEDKRQVCYARASCQSLWLHSQTSWKVSFVAKEETEKEKKRKKSVKIYKRRCYTSKAYQEKKKLLMKINL